MCTWSSFKFICTYQGGVLSTYRTKVKFIHTLFWNFQEKWISSIKVQFHVYLMPCVSSCLKNSLSLFWKCCHQLPKKGRFKASRPLIRVLVINDNIYGLTISWENLNVRLVHENVCISWFHEKKLEMTWMVSLKAKVYVRAFLFCRS